MENTSHHMPNKDMPIIQKPWGHECLVVVHAQYVLKTLHVKEGHRLSKQYHKVKDETLWLRAGRAILELEYEASMPCTTSANSMSIDMVAGIFYRIEPNTIHRIIATTDCEIGEVSSNELDDVVRLEDDYDRD